MRSMQDVEYGPMAGEEDLPAVLRAITLAFGLTADRAEGWLRGAGLEHMRVVREREGEPVVGCLMRVPMGQYFGGRSLRMLGFAGVAVMPEARGRGIARRMMAAAMREARAEGYPLAGLYASTQELYRQVGFEPAGHHFTVRIPLGALARPRFSRGGRVLRPAPLAPEHNDAVRACYAAYASRGAGMLDRGAYCWGRVEVLRGEPFHGYGLFAPDGALEAYAYVSQRMDARALVGTLAVTDMAFTTPRAARELLDFLFSFATISEAIQFQGGPVHPLLLLLSEGHFEVTRKEYSFTRVVDPAGALTSRGYLAGLQGEVVVELEDATLRDNSATWRLRVAGGRGTVERTAAPARGAAIRTDVRGLAAIYTGFLTASQAAMAGLLDGEPEALTAADALFAGPTPWMTDMY